MVSLLDTKDTRWLHLLSRWALVSGLALLGVLVTFGIGAAASQGSALPPEYDELVWAAQLPVLYRVAAAFDLATWLGLDGLFILIATGFACRAPIRSSFIAACGAGQLAGAIGAFTRLIGVSDVAARYAIAVPDQQPALLRSFLDLQLVINAHFAAGSLLWSAGLLLVAWAAWSARVFPRWLAVLLALAGACNLMGDLIGIADAPLPFALFILPLILLVSSLFGIAGAC
ncbi:MAG TPA: DUF4386 family protein, partial [Roseiflexaceae bacterium]|nr:DUF4386 family protein [Roseiflexaceae bacterium]